MANIRCRCGNVFSDGRTPSPHEMTIVPDVRIEGLSNAILDAIKREGDLEAEIPFLLATAGPTAYKCPRCGRLLVFEDGIDKPYKSYLAET